MDSCVIYFGVFGDWRWERVNEAGALIEESHEHFEELADCVEDARLHGYRGEPGRSHELMSA